MREHLASRAAIAAAVLQPLDLPLPWRHPGLPPPQSVLAGARLPTAQTAPTRRRHQPQSGALARRDRCRSLCPHLPRTCCVDAGPASGTAATPVLQAKTATWRAAYARVTVAQAPSLHEAVATATASAAVSTAMAATTAPVASAAIATIAATAAMTSTVATPAEEATIVAGVTIAQETGVEAAVEAATAAAVGAAAATATARPTAVAPPLTHSQEEARSTLASAASPAHTHVGTEAGGTGPREVTPRALAQASALEERTRLLRRPLPSQGKVPRMLPAAG